MKNSIMTRAALFLGLAAALLTNVSAAGPGGKAIYDGNCAACHTTGVAGAPKLGDVDAWGPRIKTGASALYATSLKGKGAMPARGGSASLSDAEVKAAVDYMISQSDSAAKGAASKTAKTPNAETTKPAASVSVAAEPAVKLAPAAGLPGGKAIYDGNCTACHSTGVAGAPKTGDVDAWAPRIKTGVAALYATSIKGKGAMPARGGSASLSDAEVKAAVDYMISQSDPGAKGAVAKVAKPATAAAADTAKPAVPVPVATRPAEPAATIAIAAPPVEAAVGGAVNTFNRLMLPPAKRNLPPWEDGIHDASNDGTRLLQAPLTAFAALPKSNEGNRVDWGKSLNEDKISPRADRNDPNAKAMVMDMNIVREVKGSMPDVVFPHKQHTQWLDCSNCHPAIFIPQKGANQISMASILLGQQCGVCHGKVAFPVSDCRRCHSKSKAVTVKAEAKP